MLVQLLLIAVILYIIICWMNRRQGTILTSTTFFDFKKENHWDTFCKGIDSILELHSKEDIARINKWVIINEWDANPRADWATMITTRYPFIEFIQKEEKDKGQAKSLNMILDIIAPYEYWIHWEEAWYAETPFLGRAFHIMDTTPTSQLQMTTTDGLIDWKNISTCHDEYCTVIQKQKGMAHYFNQSAYTVNWGKAIEYWPCYSLRPSINRAAFYQKVGYFSTDPKLWPGRFEWEYGVRWYCANGIKSILPDGPIRRKKSHVSTYH